MAVDRIDPLDWQAAIVDPKTGTPSHQFGILWQRMFGNTETLDADITTLAALVATKADKVTQMIAGAGLTGGGTLAADRTFNVGAGTGLVVNADDVAIDTTAEAERIRDVIGTALVAGSGVTITVSDVGDTITIAATGGTSKFPLVDGSVPPELVYQEDGSLVYVEI